MGVYIHVHNRKNTSDNRTLFLMHQKKDVTQMYRVTYVLYFVLEVCSSVLRREEMPKGFRKKHARYMDHYMVVGISLSVALFLIGFGMSLVAIMTKKITDSSIVYDISTTIYVFAILSSIASIISKRIYYVYIMRMSDFGYFEQ